MSKNPNDLEILKARLEAFEKNLQDLVRTTQEDLIVAEALQKALMPNRVPEIPGIKIFAKLMSAKQLSAESFDILPTRDHRAIWIITSWTERFGLSSLLLQVLVHLQSVALLETQHSLGVSELFNDLSLALTQTQKSGHYCLRVLKLDMTTLKLQGHSVGLGPLLVRKRKGTKLGDFEMLQAEGLIQNPAWMQKGFSERPVLAEDSYTVSGTLEPGSRLFVLGREWNAPAGDLESLIAPLGLSMASTQTADAQEDLNQLMFNADQHRKKLGLESDITGISLEIDPRKLHLA